MTSIIEILPVEIIIIIVDSVVGADKYDKRNIRACSLTCRALLPLCRRHIFRHIKLDAYYYFNDVFATQLPSTISFHRLITKAPEIAHYVEDLHIRCMNEGRRTCDEFVHCYSLLFVLPELTKLRTISLSGSSSQGYLDWQALPSVLKDVLCRIFHLSTITSLKFSFINDFTLSTLMPCTALTTLSFERVDLAEIDEVSTIPPVKPVQLAKLECEGYNSYRILLRILSQKRSDGIPIFSLEQLQVFTMHIESTLYLQQAEPFFKSIPQVEIINLAVSYDIKPAEQVVTSIFPCLETLIKLVLNINIDITYADPLSGICAPLTEMASKNRLEVLEVCLSVFPGSSCSVGDEWNELEKALLSPGWSHLKRVHLSIFLHVNRRHKRTSPLKALSKLPRKQLRRLATTESLDFAFTVKEIVQKKKAKRSLSPYQHLLLM